MPGEKSERRGKEGGALEKTASPWIKLIGTPWNLYQPRLKSSISIRLGKRRDRNVDSITIKGLSKMRKTAFFSSLFSFFFFFFISFFLLYSRGGGKLKNMPRRGYSSYRQGRLSQESMIIQRGFDTLDYLAAPFLHLSSWILVVDALYLFFFSFFRKISRDEIKFSFKS